ncbi:hypothetical protein [Novosphingobium sp. CF614]|uniref:hypothetical protein n=1 Tax=Novosphingobium sp. CF614 TaxID=1884364 RepID=UPI000A9711D0|nr:hypothetical protein [Novosphingobium sp. CF614]
MSFHTTRMKANPRTCAPIPKTMLLTALLTACVPQPPAVPPAPRPAPPPIQRPAPRPAPPTPMPSAAPNWHDAPATPGGWQWTAGAAGSTASFAGGQFVMRCQRAQGTVSLLRAATGATAPAIVTIMTTQGAYAINGNPVAGGIEAVLPARDSRLDAMAFSRGRFAVLVAGLAPLYVPSWTEVSRIIEDCR